MTFSLPLRQTEIGATIYTFCIRCFWGPVAMTTDNETTTTSDKYTDSIDPEKETRGKTTNDVYEVANDVTTNQSRR